MFSLLRETAGTLWEYESFSYTNLGDNSNPGHDIVFSGKLSSAFGV